MVEPLESERAELHEFTDRYYTAYYRDTLGIPDWSALVRLRRDEEIQERGRVERLRTLLQDLHTEFRDWVSSRRGARLKAPAEELFTGRFWPGRRAVELGIADRLGDAHSEARRRFGPKVRLIPVGGPRRPLLQRLLPSVSAEAAIAALEERAAWARLGL